LYLLGVEQFIVTNVSDPTIDGLMDSAAAAKDEGKD
jgi:uncharacterized membrane protein